MRTTTGYGRRMQFRVLGPLEVDAGDGPLPLGGPKQRAVLASLLIRANQVVSADTLIDEVWGDEPPERARHTLQTYVSNLRRTLGDDRVQGRTPGYMLVLDPLDLDAARFDALMRDAKKALPADPIVAIATLDDALELWRGPALADLADRSSLVSEAARLDDLRLEAQEDRIEGLLATGAQSRAIGELENLVARHPLRESLWGRLMLALYRDGRQADALGAYQRAREILADELGIDPSPELAKLHERVLKQDPGLELRGEPLRGYRLLERIDDGPTGTVFRALQPHVGRDVAIKFFHEHVALDPMFVRRFEAEAQAVAALEHPHIAPIYDYWREPGRAYMVVRYLRGGSLRGLMERGDQLPRDRALRVVEQIASALAFAHRQGVAHGNLCSSNVVLDAEGNAYLSDFRVGIGSDATSSQDVRSFAQLVTELLRGDMPPLVGELVARAEVGTDLPEAVTFAEAALAILEPATARHRSRENVRNPFKGLRAFTAADSRDFFGRAELTERLLTRLNETGPASRFLAVVGPSGSGKSSVVHAGLVPALRGKAFHNAADRSVAAMYPGAHPIDELAAALLSIAVRSTPRLHDVLERGSRGLLEAIDLVAPDGSEIVLIVDQFEELFTLTTSEHERESFLETLRVAAADPRSRLRVIVTLRADFYDRPLVHPRFGELLATRTEGVPPLTPDELEQAIRRPAEQEGVRLGSGLVAEVIADVAHQPGALPLLQYALTDLFEHRDGERLTLAAYREMGGIAGAVSARAERTYLATDPDGQRAIKEVLLRLVTLGEGREDTRRRVATRELDGLDVDPEAITDVLDVFGRHRLLTFDREPATREPTVEIAHEALLHAWERLRGWIDVARDDLRTEGRLARAAAEWRGSHEDPSFLLHGARLEHGEAWAASTDLAIARDLRTYLSTSVDQRARERADETDRRERETEVERRSVRRLRALVAVFAIAALAAASLTTLATRQGDRAERAAKIANAKGLAAAAVANLQADPERSILLAMEAVDETRSVDGSVLPEAEEALHQAVTTSRVVMTTSGIGGAVAWSAEGVFVTEGPEGSGIVDIRDAETAASVLPPFRGHEDDVTDVAFSPDGSMLATTGDDGALHVWDPETGDRIMSESGRGAAWAPSFNADSTLVAAAWGRGVRIVDLASGDVIRAFPQRSVEDAALSADGRRIALVAGGGGVVMNVATGDEAVRLDGPELVAALAWSPDDRQIVTVGFSGVIEIWDARTGAIQHELWGQKSFVWAVAWNPDGSQIVTGGSEGAAQVWKIGENEGRELLSLSSLEMTGGIGGVAFSPDGSQVMAGAADRSAVKVWDVGATGDAEWANLPARSFLGDVGFMPDGDRVAVTTGRDSATIWSIDPLREVRTIGISGYVDYPDSGNPTLAVSPDGDSILIEGGDRRSGHGKVAAYDTDTGTELFSTSEQSGPDATWSPNGTLVAMGAGPGSVRILDRSGRQVTVLREEDDDHHIGAVSFSPDGILLATSVNVRGNIEGEGIVRIWDWARGDIVREVATGARTIAFDPTGARLVTFDGRVVESWDLRTGARVATEIEGDPASISAVAFGPGASRIATGSTDGVIRLFDAATGEQLMVLRGHTGLVNALAFSPDGRKLASTTVSIAGDSVRVWALDLDDLLALAEREVTRSLTDVECRQFLPLERCPEAP